MAAAFFDRLPAGLTAAEEELRDHLVRASRIAAELLPPGNVVSLQEWVECRMPGEVDLATDAAGLVTLRPARSQKEDHGRKRPDDFFKSLPQDSFTPEEERLRFAILDFLAGWTAKDLATMEHLQNNPHVLEAGRIQNSSGVSLKDWIERRIGGELTLQPGRGGSMVINLAPAGRPAVAERVRGLFLPGRAAAARIPYAACRDASAPSSASSTHAHDAACDATHAACMASPEACKASGARGGERRASRFFEVLSPSGVLRVNRLLVFANWYLCGIRAVLGFMAVQGVQGVQGGKKSFFETLPADELLPKELELRQLLFDHLDCFIQNGGAGEGPMLSSIAQGKVCQKLKTELLKREVSLRDWIDRRIGGEIATKVASNGQVIIHYRNENDQADAQEPEIEEPMEGTEISRDAQAFFDDLPPDGFLPEEEALREAILNFLDSSGPDAPPTLREAQQVPERLPSAWFRHVSARSFGFRLSKTKNVRHAMRLLAGVQLLASLWLLQPASSQQLGQIKGRISIPHKYQEVISAASGAGLAAARVILDGGLLSALPASDGHFALNGVAVGPHILQVVHPLLSFDPVRVEAAEGSAGLKMSAYIADMEHGKGVKLKYPLGLAPSGAFSYLEKREEFNVLSVFKSPYALFGLVSMGAMLFLPKLQSMVEEEKERQQQELQQQKPEKKQGAQNFTVDRN
ncbi:EMC7 [Symbiodinium sp. CCMP2592]|nr:EMC7 [Symbiodinium sp. CCMP2592]